MVPPSDELPDIDRSSEEIIIIYELPPHLPTDSAINVAFNVHQSVEQAHTSAGSDIPSDASVAIVSSYSSASDISVLSVYSHENDILTDMPILEPQVNVAHEPYDADD